MPGSIADLKNTYIVTRRAFNNHNWDEVRRHLDSGLTITQIQGRRSNLSGTAKPKTFDATLHDSFSDDPHFLEDNPTFDPNDDQLVVGDATITGTALWHDTHGDDHIGFEFTCHFVDGRGWLFTKVSASVTGGGA
jgi:hypothetical protein